MAELHVAPNGAVAAPSVAAPAYAPLISHQRLQELYDLMLRYGLADTALRQAFVRKRWSAQHLPALGYPAVCAGLFANLDTGDSIAAPGFALAANLAAGADLTSELRNVIGRATQGGKSSRKAKPLHASQQLAAVAGFALAQQTQREERVVLAFPAREFSLSDKPSAAVLRWSAERHLPILFVTFARSLPKPGQSQSSFGLPQIAVDANDVVAVYRVAQECVHRARTGIGPTWIQCVTPGKADEAEPLAVMQKFLQARGLFDPARKAATTKAWREGWKQAWQSALRPEEKRSQAPPIRSFDTAR
jgi:acetoin:2,6-dichlorophenolindophenol oxidoreductase subunit alpha